MCAEMEVSAERSWSVSNPERVEEGTRKATWRRRRGHLHGTEREWELGPGQGQKGVPGRGSLVCLYSEARGMAAREAGAARAAGARGRGGTMTQAARLRLHFKGEICLTQECRTK